MIYLNNHKLKVSKKYIVLLDELFDDPQYVAIRGYTNIKIKNPL